jgi:sensor histidine kinase YesM
MLQSAIVDTTDTHGESIPAPLSTRAMWLIGWGGAFLFALTVAGQIYLSMLNHGHSYVRLVVWQLCSWSVWAVATPTVLRLGARLSAGPMRRRAWRLVATSAAIMAAHVLVATIVTVWLQPYVPVQTFSLIGAFIIQALSVPGDVIVYGILLLTGSSLAVYHRARNLAIRESQLEADLARAQLDALRLEIEPHFLFNTLNSIASLIRARASERALSMLLGLSELLRATVDGTRQQTTTLGEEAAFVKQYIELQRMRFSDRLDVRYAISPESEPCAVPAFLLQPLVENAIRHGVGKRSGPCRLELAASVDGGDLHVWVRDDGAGLPPDFNVTDHAGTGLRNTQMRLQRLYNGSAQLQLESADGGGTIAHIRLPAKAGPSLRMQPQS